MLIFWHSTVGGRLSVTVTVALQVALLLFTSVANSVTVFAPMFAQANKLGETLSDAMPQLSVELLLTCAAVKPAWPFWSR